VDLLCNEDLIKREHLVFADRNLTELDPGDNPVYDDVNSGIWWRETAERMKMDHPDVQDQSVLWPLIMFIDGMSHFLH
jgi:hypothetical protein